MKNQYEEVKINDPNNKDNQKSLVQRQYKIQDHWKKIKLITNLYQLDIIFQNERYEYELKITDDKDVQIELNNRKLSRKVYQACENQIVQKLGVHVKRGWNIYGLKKIDNQIISFATAVDNQQYTVALKFVKSLLLDNVIIETSRGNQITQLLNSVIKRGMLDLKFKEYGFLQKFFDPQSFQQNDQVIDKYSNVGLMIGNGYYVTTQISQKIPYLLVDSCCKIFRGQTALDFINSYKNNDQAREELINQVIKANYGNEQTYIVIDLDTKKNPNCTFDFQGKQISYKEYLLKRYQQKIINDKQPLIVTKCKRKDKELIYLVPELMQMTGLTNEMQKNGRLMRDVSKFTQKHPNKKIQENLELIAKLNNQLMKNGLQINNPKELPTADGFVLPKPKITIGNKKIIDNSKGNFNLTGAVYEPILIKKWILIFSEIHKKGALDFVDCMQECSKRFEITIQQPILVSMKAKSKSQEWSMELNANLQQNKDCELVVSILPQYNEQIYNELKQLTYQTIGVIHQNLVQDSLKRNPQSVCSNILLQINAKLGNKLWIIEKPEDLPKKTMIIGIDVFHHNVNQSYAGFVASIDPLFTRYYSQVIKQQKKGTEELKEVNSVMINALNAFWEQTRKQFLPELIIVYRDGVGDSQIEETIINEIKLIQSSFEKMSDKQKDYNPQFAFILVNKRINQRFFVKQDKQSYSNPESGTVVLDKIVLSDNDFYLVAQNVNQGTCTPTHYTICHNSTKLALERFIELTYFQTFNYFNWHGPVRVPGAVMYAHKLAYLAGQTLKGNVKENLRSSLYQI